MFSNLIGNASAKHILSRMITLGRVPHALLFSGPSGVGKKLFAIELAKAILGEAHARKVDSGHHPDLRIFSPEGKSGMHPLTTIHQLQDQMALKPFEADARVFIIDDADRMLPTSSNALLKTLEEPEKNNYLILITHRLDDIINTIQSRSRIIPFYPVDAKELSAFIEKKFQKAESDAHQISFLSHGSISKAIELIDKRSDDKRKLLIEILASTRFDGAKLSAHITELERLINDSTSEDPNEFFIEVDQLLEEVYYWYRDLHLLSLDVSKDQVFHLDAIEMLQKVDVKKIPALESIGSYIEECRLAVHRTIKLKTALEYLFSQVIGC